MEFSLQPNENNRKVKLPTHATLIITNRCNLNCIFCYTNSNTLNYRELKTNQWKQIISKLADIPIFQLYIGGGEPFIRPDCVELLNFAHELNLIITTSTNGSYLSEKIINKLPNSLHFQVSIHGLKNTHDNIKGSQNFDCAMHAARLIKQSGKRLCIGTVVSAMNKDELPNFYKRVILEIRPDLWHVMRLQPFGRASSNYSDLGLSNPQWVSIVHWLRGIRLKEFPISIDSSYDLEGFDNLDARDAWFYWRDIGVDICIWPNGDITPSDLLNHTKWKIGNICNNKNIPRLIQQSDVLAYLWDMQNSVNGKCVHCKAYSACRGGSRAVAFALTNDITKPDPLCPHNPPKQYAYDT